MFIFKNKKDVQFIFKVDYAVKLLSAVENNLKVKIRGKHCSFCVY